MLINTALGVASVPQDYLNVPQSELERDIHSTGFYKNKAKNAQEAHEAIRPTSALRTPSSIAKYLDDDARRLYELVWKRTVASQMVPATMNTVSVELAAGSEHSFRASGTTIIDPGFLAVYEEGKDAKTTEDEDEGRKLPLMLSILWFSVFAALSGFSTSYAMLFALRVLPRDTPQPAERFDVRVYGFSRTMQRVSPAIWGRSTMGFSGCPLR